MRNHVDIETIRQHIKDRVWYVENLLDGTIDYWTFNYCVLTTEQQKEIRPVYVTTMRTFSKMVSCNEKDAPCLTLWIELVVIESIQAYDDVFIVLLPKERMVL
jgi:hypothetical protein